MIYVILLVGALVLAPAPTSYASDIISDDLVSGINDELEDGLDEELEAGLDYEPEAGLDDELEAGFVDDLESELEEDLDSGSIDDLESVSAGDAESVSVDDLLSGDIMLLSSYDAQSATISTDIVNYFRGIVAKFPFGYHYVLFRSGNYQYIFAYGYNLSYSGTQFTGSNVDVIIYNSQSTSFSYTHEKQSSFILRPLNGLIYTDLVDYYPSLSDVSAMSLRQLLYFAVIAGLVWTMGNFMKFGGARFARKKYYR